MLHNGIQILEITLRTIQKPSGESFLELEPDGTKLRRPRMDMMEIQTSVIAHPKDANLVIWPGVYEGISAIVLIEALPINVAQRPTEVERLPIR